MDARNLIRKLAKEEGDLLTKEIFAPYFPTDSFIETQIAGIRYKLRTQKRKKYGFGIFRPQSSKFASFVREASEEQAERYLNLLPEVKGILVFQTDFWYCIPINRNSYQHLGFADLTSVLQVSDAQAFDYFVGRFDGRIIWFQELDPNCDIEKIETLKEQAKTEKLSKIKGLTPEDKIAFELSIKKKAEQQALTFEGRLKAIFSKKGASLDSYKEIGNQIEVKWKSKKGEYYTSIVRKKDLTIVSAGICLSNEDTKFDLHSLIGVVSQGENRRLIHRTAGHLDDDYYDDDDDW